MTDPKDRFRYVIRAEREAQGLNKIELARRAGISHSAIQYIESGERGTTLYTADALCRALGITFTIGAVEK